MSRSAAYQHPADLVVDQFGAFLGKRSQRLTIRFPAPKSANKNAEKAGGDAPCVIRFPGKGGGTAADSTEQSASAPKGDEPAAVATQQLVSLLSRADRPLPEDQPPGEAAEADESADGLDAGYRKDKHGYLRREVPLSRLRSVVIAGRGITISSDLVEALVERGIQLSLLSNRGEPVASLTAPALGATVQTRRAQLAAYSLPVGLELARAFVAGKLRNQQHNLRYFAKYLKSSSPQRFELVNKKADSLANLRRQLKSKPYQGPRLDDVRDRLMGLEGTGGRLYWEGVTAILAGNVEFSGRVTRGALDPLNSALNYGYGILYAQTFGAIANAGLEPYAGFLHVDRPGKPSLVLDLVEEFRAPVVDRPVLAMANQGVPLETDKHGLQPAVRRRIADRILERLNTAVPFEGKRHVLRNIIQMQARHLATAIRGERTYKPFASRW